MSVGPITVILASLSPGDPTSDLHVFRVSYGAKGSAVGVTDRPQNTVTVKTCSNMLKRSVTMDNISNYNKHLQSFVARDSFTMLNLYIGIASIN